ncbi:NAD(P)/FAD-dependent oxidoreductase [Streptosporangium sp. NPDC020145]|uniref:FAD-dependent oxidoreductase n=1 Tax=Streptosporangium sp. NPDC020145 TaxID=3154694 RepID=UPI003446F959
MNTPRIAVIGAGPGGLTCATILQKHGIAVTVHEADAAAEVRDQGGSLDLHADSGQLALKEAGLLESFFALSRPEGQEMRQYDATSGELGFHHVPDEDEAHRPEIERGVLRDMLLDSLTPGTVRWGHALRAVEGPSDGPRLLRFTDSTTTEADLVIGADGAWSPVRAAISAALPQYTGITFVEAWFHDADTRHPDIAEFVGNGSAIAGDGARGMFAQHNGGGHIRVYLIQRLALDWLAQAGLTHDDTEGIRAFLLDAYRDWAPGLRRVITDNDGRYLQRPINALPVPHIWEPSPTITLLGDAAHLMPPLGLGVNLAMLDALELALALAHNPVIDDALRAYEKTMIPRSRQMQTELDGRAADLMADDPFDAEDPQAHLNAQDNQP